MKSHATTTAMLIFLLGTGYLSAQQPLFAPLGAVWHYDKYNCPPLPSPEPYSLTVTEDTIINGKYCTRLPDGGCHANASCQDQVYVYQEGSKVFVYEPLFNDFQMLYDFSLQTGDSYSYVLCIETWEVDTVSIHVDFADDDPTGVQWLRVVPNHPVWWGELSSEIIKGVGGSYVFNRLLFPDFGCLDIQVECPSYVFKCYETPDSVNYPAGCFVSAVDDIANEIEQILLYPNPASSSLNIEIKEQRTAGKNCLRIADARGRLLKEVVMQPSKKNHVLTVQDWPSGMYFLQYLEDGEVKAAERFVVQR